MPYIVLGYDGDDEGALERRMAVRADHVALGDKLRDEGKVLYGVAMLNDDGQMIGSVYIMNMDSREELDAWLEEEPYVKGDVWRKIEIIPGMIGPSFLK